MEEPEDAALSSSGGEGHPDLAPGGAITWAAPLDWLEEIIPGSPVLENLRRSLFQPSSLVNVQTPSAVQRPTSCEPLSELREIGGSVVEEASGLQRDGTGTSTSVSVASVPVWMSPINPSEGGASVRTEEQASLLDMGSSTPISVASAELRVSSPNIPETDTITTTEENVSDFQQGERTDGLLPPTSLTNPTEVSGGTSKEEETIVLQRDKFATAISVAFPEMCESTLEVGGNPLKEETASILQVEEGTDALLVVPSIDAKVSPPSPNVPEIGSGSSVLQKQGEYPSTPFTVASAAALVSPLNFSEAGEGTATEVNAPTSCPLGCRCRTAWTSPLSLLEAEADASVEGRDPTRQPGMSNYTTAGPGASAKGDKGTGTTPVSAASVATWTTPPSLLGVGVNTSPAEKAATKDNTAETDSLLWRCSRDELSRLSRSELEGRLESTLIIMEALSRQMRACQDFQASGAPKGPADQRDAGTQTPVSDPKEEEQLYHHLYMQLIGRYQALCRSRESERGLAEQLGIALEEMKTWMSDSGTLLETVDNSYLRIREDRRSLGLQQKQVADLVSQCRNKLQRSAQKQAEMKEEMEKALKVKEAAELVLDSVRDHAGARIEHLEQALESQKRLLPLLQEANRYMADLSLEYNQALEEMDHHATALRECWTQIRHDYERYTSMVTKCLLSTKKMAAEMKAAREEVAQHQEVCRKLEERTAEVVEALGRVNQLTEAKATLERDLVDALQRVNVVERENEELHQEKSGLSQQLAEAQNSIRKLEEAAARLSQEKAVVERERDSAQQDAREASDCREFMEQENQITRRQLAETEEELKLTLATLRERSAQLEDLKDAHRMLQEERETLCVDLAASKAEIQSTRVSMEEFSKSLLEMKGVHSQFLEMADFLRAATRGEASDMGQKSLLYTPGRPTPRRLGSSFVESVLQAVADKDLQTPGLLSETTAFTKTTPVRPPTPSEVREDFSACVQDLRDVATRLRHLISQHQEAAMEEAQSLEAEILQLKQNLEDLEHQLQAEREAGGANLAKLNKALHMRIQNEKDLQKLMRQQDERLRTLSDQSREVALLKDEISQLKYALQKSETEVTTLWEELRATKPSEEERTREKIWLRKEMGKLQELLLEKDDERVELQSKYLGQMRLLKSQLQQAKQALEKHEKTATEMNGALTALPPDIAAASEVP